MRASTLIWLMAFIAGTALAEERLIFAVDVIRHGDRTPLQRYDSLDYPWQHGPGQLTPKGIQQLQALGHKLRRYYIHETKLLPETYQDNLIYIRSTDYDRTIMSAQSFLVGLYPIGTGPHPIGFQPIPVHSFPKNHDVFTPNEQQELAFKAIQKKVVTDDPVWRDKQKKAEFLCKRLSTLFNTHLTSINDLIRLADTVYICQLYNIALPKELTASDTQALFDIAHSSMIAKYQHPETIRLLAGPSFQYIQDKIQEAAHGKTSLKYMLISGHDGTLLMLLGKMGYSLKEIPHYASHLSFRLYESEEHQRTIRVFFNDKEITNHVCQNALCTNQFAQLD